MDSELATYRNAGALPFEYDLHNPAFRIEYAGIKDRDLVPRVNVPPPGYVSR